MKKSELVSIIRTIVAEEVRKQLPGIVTEMYLRKIVTEQSGGSSFTPRQKKMSLEDTFEQEMQRKRDEHVPESMDNSDEGIYAKGPIGRKNEAARSALLSPDNPFAAMYEDTVRRQNEEDSREVGAPIVGDFSTMNEIYKRMKESSSSNRPMQQTAEAQLRDLEMRRAALDAKVVK